ncbi:MAG TPA: glycosyltransferase [Nitrososphaerales archaeon]|nr:glycosyltransferase [Nitrososphaerales archaeon]
MRPIDAENVPSRESVAYILKRYPRLSETFILNEILALEELGLRIKIVSIHYADTKTHKHARFIRAPVYYLPESIWPDLPQLLRAQGHFMFIYPSRWIRSFSIMFRRHSTRAVRHWLLAGLVARRLEGSNTSHIHAHFSTSPTTIAMISSVLLGLRYSMTCHAKDVYAEGRLRSPGLFRNLNRASFVVVASRRTKEDILNAWPALPSTKVHVVYNGLDLSKFEVRNSEPRDHLILSVGRLVEKKGFPYILQACGLLKERGTPFKCEIVGYGGMRRGLEELVNSLGLNGNVVLVGALAQDELILHYRNAFVFCLAPVVASNEDRDVLPNVVKEAMAVGVPVVTTSIPGMEEMVQTGRSGLLVPSKDPKAIADALELLLNDGEVRSQLSAGGRRVIEERFDMTKNVAKLYRLFETQMRKQPIPQSS